MAALTVAAIRSACSGLRFATTMLAAPIRAAVPAASELIDPAPTTSTLRAASEPAERGRGEALGSGPVVSSRAVVSGSSSGAVISGSGAVISGSSGAVVSGSGPGARPAGALAPGGTTAGGEAAGGHREPDAHQAHPGPVDARLRVRPLARVQRVGAQFGEGTAEGALLPGGLQGLAHLAEYLALADHHRVKPAGDRQQMLDGTVLVVHVKVRGELGERDAGVPGQQLADGRYPAVELVHVGVDLRAVAGADHEGPRDVLGLENVVRQLAERVTGHDGPLERGERCAGVAEADHEHAHFAIACASGSVSSSMAAMSAEPTGPSPPRRRT